MMNQSSDVPVEVVVAAFNDADGAENALRQLKEVKKEGFIGIKNAAVLWKDESGKLRFKETADMRGGKGAAIGGVVGGVVGLVFPPAMLATAGIGAAVGGLSAKLHDSGFPDERLREVGEGLKPNTSAIIAVIEHVWAREIVALLQQYSTDVVTEVVRADIAAQLDEMSVPVTASSGESPTSQEAAPTTATMPTEDASRASETPPPTAQPSGGSAVNP